MAWRSNENKEHLKILLDLPAAQYPLTMMAWLYIVAARDAGVQLFKVPQVSAYGPAAGITATNKLAAFWDIGGMASTGTTLSPETWYHVTITATVTTVSCYLNGGAVADSTAAMGTAGVPVAVYAGYDDWSYWLDGRLAHFRLWPVVLSNEEILAEKASATAVKTADLWCDHPLTNSLADSSGLGHDFTVGSGTPTYEDGPTFVTPGSIWPTVTM